MTGFTPPPPMPPEGSGPPQGPPPTGLSGPAGPAGPSGSSSGGGGRGRVRALIAGVGVLGLVLVVLVVTLVVRSNNNDGSDTADHPATTPPNGSTSSSPAPTTTSGAATGDRGTIPAGLSKFYTQQLSWTSCSGGTQCATLTVPIDYDKPDGATFGLKVRRLQAADPSSRVGSLVVNPGGPGAPGTTMLDSPSFFFGAKLLDDYDIVAFDPRGTGGSDPVDCLTDSQLDSFISQDPEPSTAAEGQKLVAMQDAFFKGCVADSDSLVGHVSTVEAAKDMDVLRAALEQPQLDYLGFSYGTKLGATYADLFPKNVGRFVLDGAVDPELSFKQAALVQAGGFQTALDSYVDNCLSQGSCFLGSTRAAALTKISDLLDSIEKSPLPTSLGGRTLSAGNAFYGIITPLYSRDNWSYLDQGLKQALGGDGSTLLALSDSYSSRSEDGSYTDNSLEAQLSISCLDDPSTLQASQIPAQYPAFLRASPTFGRVFAWGLVGCHGVQTKAEFPTPPMGAPGANPILVLGTTRDPATPFSEAKALASELDSGVLISRDGDGHTAYNKGNSCIDDAVEGYLVAGTVPKSGLAC